MKKQKKELRNYIKHTEGGIDNMIGWHITEEGIANSNGNFFPFSSKTELSTLDTFLGESRKEINVFYHLEASVAILLKHIGITESEAKKLLDANRIYIAPYTLRHYSNRMLCIDYGFGAGHAYVNIYDAKQYNLKGTVVQETYTTEEAITKAKEAKAIGSEVLNAFKELELPTYKLTSPINVYLTDDPIDMPLSTDIPEAADLIAYQSIKGNWLEAFSCGYWEDAYDYDINGAYASELARLVDLRQGKWVRSNTYTKQASYGFIKGEITTWAKFHPFLYRRNNDSSYTPVGSWETCLTLQEYNFLYKYKLGTFKIKEAWWWIADKDKEPNYLFKSRVEGLYQKRLATENAVLKDVIHRILAGLWGKFSEVKSEGLGKYANSAYAAIVEANSRLKVTKACLDNNIIPLHIAVDGIITNRLLRLNLSNKLGEWRLSHKGKCIIVNSGVVGFEGKNGNEEFSLTYDKLYNSITENPQAQECVMSKYTVVSLAKALNTDFSKLGNTEKLHRSIVIGADNKRIYNNRVTTGSKLLETKTESMPIEVGMISSFV